MNTRFLLGMVFLIALGTISYAVTTAPSALVSNNAPAQAQGIAAAPSSQTASGYDGNDYENDGDDDDARSAPAQQTQTTAPTKQQTAAKPSGYTLAQVAQHSTASSCWAAINGKVYDLTSWIDQHPGGPERILSICGKDGSAAFNDQHGGQRAPEQELAQFYIGALTS